MSNRSVRLTMWLAASLLVALALQGCWTRKAPEDVPAAAIGEAQPIAAEAAPAPVEEAPEPAATPAEAAPEKEGSAPTEAPAEASAPEGPAPADAAAEEPPSEQDAASITYTIEPNDESLISWVGYGGILGQIGGGFGNFEGQVTVPDGNIEAAQIEVGVDMFSIYSEANALTKKLKGEEFFEASDFPMTTFTSTAIAPTEAGYNVTGNLDKHGAVFSITFPATIEIDGDTLKTDAEFKFNRHAWGIDYDGTGDNFIQDDVLLRFTLEAPAAS